MNIAIILNGISRKKQFFYKSILPPLQKQHAITVFETRYAGHATELARAAASKFATILSAGGDGTLNQVLNGVLTSQNKMLPILGLIPLGSGNDFAGAIGASASAQQLLQLLNQAGKPTDVGFITCKDFNGYERQHYFINVCSAGMGPATIKQMEKAPAWMGANLRYLTSIIKTFFTHTPEPVELKTQTWNWRGVVRVLAIANGKSFGNRIYLAPEAKQDDGLFNLFAAGDVPLLKFLLYLQTLKQGSKIHDSQIQYELSNKIEITSEKLVAIEAEGELVGFLPATICMKSKLVSFLR